MQGRRLGGGGGGMMNTATVLGFRHGEVVYPLSLLALMPPALVAAMPLEPILDFSRLEDEAASGLAAHTKAPGISSEEEEGVLPANEQEVLLEFPLPRDCGSLAICSSDVEELRFLLDKSKINEKDATEVLMALLKATEEVDGGTRIISKRAFDSVIRNLIPNAHLLLSNKDRDHLSSLLSNIFFAFDRDNTNDALADELIAGFLVLCKGSKSYKLLLAFGLFDPDRQGALSPIDFSRFLRSFLTVLFALNRAASSLSVDEIFELIDSAVVKIIKIFHKDQNKRISLEEFGTFYNKGGHSNCGWLELLDLSKWVIPLPEKPAKPSFTRQTSDRTESSLESFYDLDNRKSAAPLFLFSLFGPEVGGESYTLEVQARDVENLEKILIYTDFDDILVKDLYSEFAAVARHGRIDKKAYDACIHKIISPEHLADEDKRFLNQALSNIFFAYDRNYADQVDSKNLAAGFSFLCAGSKSDKLAIAWKNFDLNKDGELSREQLSEFLCSLLTMVFALTNSTNSRKAEEIWTIADKAASNLVENVFHLLKKENATSLTFEDFAKWYSFGGSKRASWLELLDPSKWKRSTASVKTVLPIERMHDDDDDDDEEEEEDDEEVQELVFDFALSKDGPQHLLISRSDIERLERVVKTTKFVTMNAEDLLTALIQGAGATGDDGRITKTEFDKVIRSLIPGSSLSSEERRFLSKVLSGYFYAYDRDVEGSVDTAELATGMSILANGTKSDKLALTFGLFDSRVGGDGDMLTRTELHLFIRAFLTFLHALVKNHSEPSADLIWQNIDEVAVEISATIFLQAKRRKKDYVSFVEFADWYSGGGYNRASWLELLALKKWGITTPESVSESND